MVSIRSTRPEGFEAVVGDTLDELGYPRAFPEPSADARALAAEVRSAFTERLRALGRPIAAAAERI